MISTLRSKRNTWEVIGSVMGAIILSTLFLWALHIYDYISPTSWRFEYKEVTPTNNYFEYWDRITFRSTVDRKRAINMQWQDLAYCKDYEDEYRHKLPTQYRPEQWTEYITKWFRSSVWEYSIWIPRQMYICKMCGNSIGTTSRGYKKIFTYCTNEFMVNQ